MVRPAEGCVFCAIVSGTVPAAVVARDAGSCAFLDQRPVFPGHVLVVPTDHVADLDSLEPRRLASLFAEAQRIGKAIERALGADGTLVLVNNKVSQSVPHVHVHVVPRRRGDGLRGFLWPRQRYASDPERDAMARSIAGALASGEDDAPPVEN